MNDATKDFHDLGASNAAALRSVLWTVAQRIREGSTTADDAGALEAIAHLSADATTVLDSTEWLVRPGRLTWAEARSILLQGSAIQQDYAALRYASYEEMSARMDAAAREIERGLRFAETSPEASNE